MVVSAVSQLASQLQALTPKDHGFSYFDPHARAHAHGRLSGWIIPAKDLSDIAGMPTTLGNINRTYMATETDAFLASILSQGAIIPGKSLTPEMGLSAYTEPVGQARPDNPLLPGHTPGGSSGGAAVMVARGLVRAAHASDGGGSIRVPAAATGLIGFKPAHSTAGANPVVQGFLTRTLADAAYVHAIRPVTPPPLHIGVLTQPLHAETPVADMMLEAVDSAATQLSQKGHKISVLARPYGDSPFEAFSTILALRAQRIPGAASSLVEWLRERGAQLSQASRRQAVAEFMSVKDQILRAWEVDVVLSPTLAFLPPVHGYFSSYSPEEDFYRQTQWTPWATTYNMAGLAALSLPHLSPLSSIHLGALRISAAELFGLAMQLSTPGGST
ncbi:MULTISPECIES: amidase [unclassified Corynebacterium]|uniref:amidase n=1 Tax=unclassified Corynebacterium TaxID=2624378 RepID=UPI0021671F45|nr:MULTISPECIES: amidase [unclassified Corynebacterium]MCS4490118.1 amidase [Corynebacterium sp. ES2775-CONJ]MCS4532181.1 amidase [Corynebacterium sp. ES2730-CONJ]